MTRVFEHILVPYNGTVGSQKAFKKAIALAQVTQSKVTVLTCLEERTTFGLFKTKVNKQEYEKERTMVEQEHSQLEKYAIKHQVSPIFKIEKSNIPSHSILEFAEDHEVDLIIMGKRKLATRYEKVHYYSTIEDVSKSFHGGLLILS